MKCQLKTLIVENCWRGSRLSENRALALFLLANFSELQRKSHVKKVCRASGAAWQSSAKCKNTQQFQNLDR